MNTDISSLNDPCAKIIDIIGEFDAYKTGHHLNNMLLRALLADSTAYSLVTVDDGVATPAQAHDSTLAPAGVKGIAFVDA